MKRKCKNVDITNIEFIKTAIARCLKKKKETRKDIVDLRERYPDLDTLAYEIQAEIQSRSITLYPLRMREKIDTSSGKLRVIGMQNIRNQIYDYIAVMALEELSRRLGRYQCASVKGRGQIYGLKAIRKWMKNPKETRYMLKLDIKKFYPSVKHETIMSFLHKRVKNDPLLWLIGEILKSFGETGLSIGSLSLHRRTNSSKDTSRRNTLQATLLSRPFLYGRSSQFWSDKILPEKAGQRDTDPAGADGADTQIQTSDCQNRRPENLCGYARL